MRKRSKSCIIGIPDHQGVSNVGGRIGAASGPRAFREAFFRLRGRLPLSEWVVDLGDVPQMGCDVPLNHQQASDLIQRSHSGQFARSVVIGGGHDHGFSHLNGIVRALRSQKKSAKIGCINIDAHLDVRKPFPLITSGSPFFLAIEEGVIQPGHLIEFGIQSHCNGPDLWDYVEKKKIGMISFPELRGGKTVSRFKSALTGLAKKTDRIVISFDLDSVASAFAPGVSAPQPEGFTPMEILEMIEYAGKHPKVISLGIFELNPLHDVDSRTAKLAAVSAYHFLEAGF